jgi:cysteine desulfurase
MEVCEVLQADGYRISTVPVTPEGVVNETALLGALSADTLIVSVMMANDETGTLQLLNALAGIVKRYDSSILIHTDATQAIGKIHVDLSTDLVDVDLLSLSAHKFHAPKGVGALFVRDSDILAPIQFGGAATRHALRNGKPCRALSEWLQR